MESSNQGTADETNSRQTNPREKNNKEDNRRNQNKEINRKCRKEMQQKKPPSHKFIKKTARKKEHQQYIFIV